MTGSGPGTVPAMKTIYEVAAHAGVSAATVSRFINGQKVRPASEERVRRAIEELSYTPNRTARSLRLRHAQVLALIIPDIENPYFTALARGVEYVAHASGYSLMLCNTEEDVQRERGYIEIVLSEHMAGTIVAPIGDGNTLSALADQKKPFVCVDRQPIIPADCVTADNRKGGHEATEWLCKQGFERVACITGPANNPTARDRAAGWSAAVRAHQAAAADLVWADYRAEGGYSGMCDLLRGNLPPDAVFVANNLMAVGALRALRDLGIQPPDFGFSVFGDLPFMPFGPESVHVVPLHAREIGVCATHLLLKRILGEEGPPKQTIVDSEGRAFEVPSMPPT
jgi:LacI family transcriptional regulator